MKKNLFILSFLLFYLPCHSYEFAHIAKDIREEFQSKKLRTDFAENLFKKVSDATQDFRINLTCDELGQYIDQDSIDFMCMKTIENNSNMFIALVWPVVVENDQLILDHFEEYFHVIGHKRILLDAQGAKNFLSQISTKASHPTGVDLWFAAPFRNYNPMRAFLLECKPNNTNYDEMKEYLVKVFNNNQAHIDAFEARLGQRGIQNLYSATICKRKLRRAVQIDHGLHITDDQNETKELAKLVFNNRSIDCIKFSKFEKVKDLNNFNEFLRDLISTAQNSLNEIVVYNSAVLSAYGLRDCSDIDFLHNPRISMPPLFHPYLSNQNPYFSRSYVIVEDTNKKHYILEDCPNAFADEDLDTTQLLTKKISIDDLLYNPLMHFYYHGVRFASLDFMLYFKGKRGRPKDLQDVKLIQNHYLYR